MLHRLISTVGDEVFSEIIFCRGNDRRISQNRDYMTKRQAKIALRKHALNSGVEITGFYAVPILPDPQAKILKQEIDAAKHVRHQEHFAKQRLRLERRAHLQNRHPQTA